MVVGPGRTPLLGVFMVTTFDYSGIPSLYIRVSILTLNLLTALYSGFNRLLIALYSGFNK
jgi:hypothetical protein